MSTADRAALTEHLDELIELATAARAELADAHTSANMYEVLGLVSNAASEATEAFALSTDLYRAWGGLA